MSSPFELLTNLSAEHFTTVVSAAPKKLREELFRRAGIKAKGGTFALKSSQKTEGRIRKAFEALSKGVELPEEIAEEVIRQYLYTRRALLCEALDFLDVPHNEGLTDADLDFLETLPKEKVDELTTSLASDHPAWEVDLYLRFMKIPAS